MPKQLQILLLFALILISSPAQAKTLKILSLNFNSEVVLFDDQRSVIRDLRFNALVDWVRQVEPDLILITEAWDYRGSPSVATPLSKAIGYDSFYRLGLGLPGFIQDGNAILARKELHLDHPQSMILPHSAFHIGDRVHWVVAFGSLSHVVGVRVTLPGGEELYVYATHLLGATDRKMADQANALQSAIRKQVAKDGINWEQANVILGGDLNSTPDGSIVQSFVREGYVDSWAVAHPEYAGGNSPNGVGATTCGNPWGPCFNPLTLGAAQFPLQNKPDTDRRIDYLFAHGPSVHPLASTVTFTRPQGGFWMSDHYGVLSTVAIGEPDWLPASNPYSDSDDLPPLAPTQFVDVKKDFFKGGHPQAPVEVTSPRGLTIINHIGERLDAQVTGPARILPRKNTSLQDSEASSFVFTRSGDYRLELYDESDRQAYVPVRVRLPEDTIQ